MSKCDVYIQIYNIQYNMYRLNTIQLVATCELCCSLCIWYSVGLMVCMMIYYCDIKLDISIKDKPLNQHL